MERSLRLSGNERPRHYALNLDVDVERFEFRGSVRIDLEVAEAREVLRLHSVGLTILSGTCSEGLGPGSVPDGGSHSSDLSSWETDSEAEMIELKFEAPLPVGSCYVELAFAGKLSEKLEGFYRASYRNGRHMATTHFEPTDARRAFPCFDEPAFRAEFNISLTFAEERSCVSNMPVESNTEDGLGNRTVAFTKSPPMPTYLVAFVVGDFERCETRTRNGVLVEVLTPPGQLSLGKFALQTAADCLDFFEEFFSVAYPLPKVSLVAVPDFPIGAMENWGCITFRETAILTEDNLSFASVRQKAAGTICHELAHMWFGNLVTMAWWEHLWLKEGFATWAARVAVDHLHPDWREGLRFVCTSYLRALQLDSLRSTHPVEVPVSDPGQINEVFDTISYLKAASVISMLADYVGLDAFRRALKRYLERHQYGAATTVDLWRAIEAETALPIASMMGGWTQTAGYPVLALAETADGAITVSQSRFYASASAAAAAATDAAAAFKHTAAQLWMVPIRFLTSTGAEKAQVTLLEKSSDTLLAADGDRAGDDDDTFCYRLNLTRAGFYRVNYPARVWSLLTAQLAHGQIVSASDRAGLLSDAFALARRGDLPTTQALDVLAALQEEGEYAVWESMDATLSEVRRVFCEDDEEACGHWRRFVHSLASPLARKLAQEDRAAVAGAVAPSSSSSGITDQVTSHMFSVVYHLAVAARDPEILADALRRYERFRDDPRTVSMGLLHSVLSAWVMQKGDGGYDDVLALYRNVTLNEQEILCISVLGGASTTREQKARTLELSLHEIRLQDAVYAIEAVAQSGALGRTLCWSWVKDK